MLKDKYNMTTEENVLYAKRNMVDSIWKSANLEGISVTFSEAQAIYDGANVGHLRIDEIQAISGLAASTKEGLFPSLQFAYNVN